MKKLLGIGLVLSVTLALFAQEALARHGGRMGSSQRGTRGCYGSAQAYGGGSFDAMQQYQMQSRARAMQQYQMRQYQMQQYQMQHRARRGQGRGGNPQGTGEPQSLRYGVAPGSCPYGNQPGTMQQQRLQNRARLQQQDRADQPGGLRQRARTRTPVAE